ncbi:hypothetical protein L6452_23924 [Arctium lappa]|uniref:Uncharacterized protein n=1 Tax=Arctium lappa TaxID=4217 RepID=A0ACB9A952_ARCLA|nr:hypothetical protein L6452_23924 [Arctium lappa]
MGGGPGHIKPVKLDHNMTYIDFFIRKASKHLMDQNLLLQKPKPSFFLAAGTPFTLSLRVSLLSSFRKLD